MSEGRVSAMSVWPTISLLVLLQLILVLLLRAFPEFLGSALRKRVEHSFDLKLEKTKAEMRSAYATLRASIDFISTGQVEYRGRTVTAVEKLWNAVLTVKKEFNDVMFVHSVITPEEMERVVRARDMGHPLLGEAAKYLDDNHLTSKLVRIDADTPEVGRLFCGDRLWLLFFVIRAFCGRLGALMHLSLSEGQYKDWRMDNGIAQQLGTVVPTAVIEEAKQKPFFGIATLLSYLEAEFLKEARKVMSGSQGLADSLSDIQAIVKLEHEKLAETRQSAV